MVRFHGNEICCGSYACMNAIQDESIDLQLFELSTSVPFGIRHYENPYFDRLLTTYCDPNQGLDRALELWGYDTTKYAVESEDEALEILRQKLHDNRRVVLGPVDMGKLGYQVMPLLLKRMDHYITLEYWSENEVLCIDSEGFGGYRLGYQELRQYISVKEVIEAGQKITLRFIRKTKERSEERILRETYANAFRNLREAEAKGEGSGAIKNCCEFLENYEPYQWKLPLLYDIEYLQQRKWLFSVLNRRYKEAGGTEFREIIDHAEHILQEQRRILGEIYNGLRHENRLVKEQFVLLGELEGRLAGDQEKRNFI